ncbi:heavy-metal-associated domain-containing protein [Skermanella mucosa]|uniref:heavy-metal-associated domain-containing protein n=1 Tax=Skermanella mucosa TaxID=1789672 RepID=UPI00192AD1C4|nr:heavy metal-associated domain-containing protein [Skermanella mucosa]UEM21371.1 heavy-metal-associated domain-containing protein [Skermanella mucosa]
MLKLRVDGMACGGCAKSVTRAVEAIPSVERALVDLKAGEIIVEGNPDEQAVRQAIENAGFSVKVAA